MVVKRTTLATLQGDVNRKASSLLWNSKMLTLNLSVFVLFLLVRGNWVTGHR